MTKEVNDEGRKTSTKVRLTGAEGKRTNHRIRSETMKKSMEPAVKSLETIRAAWVKQLQELEKKLKEKQEDISALDALIAAAKGTPEKSRVAQPQSVA